MLAHNRQGELKRLNYTKECTVMAKCIGKMLMAEFVTKELITLWKTIYVRTDSQAAPPTKAKLGGWKKIKNGVR